MIKRKFVLKHNIVEKTFEHSNLSLIIIECNKNNCFIAKTFMAFSALSVLVCDVLCRDVIGDHIGRGRTFLGCAFESGCNVFDALLG